jgi:hypothetical protein
MISVTESSNVLGYHVLELSCCSKISPKIPLVTDVVASLVGSARSIRFGAGRLHYET